MTFIWCFSRHAFFITLVVVAMKLLPSADGNRDYPNVAGLYDPDNPGETTPVVPHMCYWCGPLAKQGIRMRTSLPCDPEITSQVILCDDGDIFCAVVATGPPYIMSKICVKKHEDDCFTTYCNTTKQWKMTCTCKGDLCNGPIRKRELTALDNFKAQLTMGNQSTINVTDLNKDEKADTIVLETTTSDPSKEINEQQTIVNGSNRDLILISSFTTEYPVDNYAPKDNENISISTTGKIDNGTEKASITIVKPTSMPPVESLHENITPTTMNSGEKVATIGVMTTQADTAETIVTLEKVHEDNRVIATTAKAKKAKNQSGQLSASFFVLISCTVIYKTRFI